MCSFGSFVETDFGTDFRRHLVVGAFGVEATSTVGRRGFDTKRTLYSSGTCTCIQPHPVTPVRPPNVTQCWRTRPEGELKKDLGIGKNLGHGPKSGS